MASRPRAITVAALYAFVTICVWVLAVLLFRLRWDSITRPSASARELFPFGEIRIGIDASYPPFALATNDDISGLDVDIGKAVARSLNIPFRFVNMGYDGLYDSLKSDQVDILISALPIDYSRSSDVLYTVPYFNAGQVLVVNRTSSIGGMADLSGQSLAFEFGSEAHLVARLWLSRIAPFDLLPYETPNGALNSARLNISTAALTDATSARLYIRQHPEWHPAMIPVTDVLYAIALSTKRGPTWVAVNEALQELINNHTIAALIEKWL